MGIVKATKHCTLQPYESRTVIGILRKSEHLSAAITEVCESGHCSNRVTVCPRVVALDNVGKNARVPVRIFNMSARPITIRRKASICELHKVTVLRSAEFTKASEETDLDPEVVSSHQQHVNSEKPLPMDINLSGIELDGEQKWKLKHLFQKWEHVFSKGPTDLGHTDLVEHEIHLDDARLFKDPYRNIPPGMYQEIREHLKEMMDCGAIRPSSSPFASNIVLVRKKDGSLRFCIDFRKLNKRTVSDAYSIPKIENTFVWIQVLWICGLARPHLVLDLSGSMSATGCRLGSPMLRRRSSVSWSGAWVILICAIVSFT